MSSAKRMKTIARKETELENPRKMKQTQKKEPQRYENKLIVFYSICLRSLNFEKFIFGI
jgi:hypothetical protein